MNCIRKIVRISAIVFLGGAMASMLSMCAQSEKQDDGDDSNETVVKTDSDSDADADSDSDTDGDADADGDTDGDSDSDGDTDTDSDSDGDADADGDADTDGDTDADGDADTDGDTDADVDTDADSDTDTDTDGDVSLPGCADTWIGCEMVGRITDKSVTVKAIAKDGVEAFIAYGTASGALNDSSEPQVYSDGIVAAVVDGLGANTRYYYQLMYRDAGATSDFVAGEEHTFHTQRSADATFTFAIQSDAHLGVPETDGLSYNDPDVYRLTLANIVAGNPDFMFDLGDGVTNDWAFMEQMVRQNYLDQRTFLQIPGASAGVFLVMGNHEDEEGWKLDDEESVEKSMPVMSVNARKRAFLNPVPDDFYTGNTDEIPEIDGDHLLEDYYAFEWGSALFVTLDPYWYTTVRPYEDNIGGDIAAEGEVFGDRWDWTLGEQQYLWLKETLENSDAPLKFVFTHQLTGGIENYGHGGANSVQYCEWGGYDPDGDTYSFDTKRPGWETPIHDLLVANHVQVLFHGHDHSYAYEEIDGMVYQEVPMAGNPSYTVGPFVNRLWYPKATIIENTGHLRVTVTPNSATVEYVRTFLTPEDGENASVADSYTVEAFTP